MREEKTSKKTTTKGKSDKKTAPAKTTKATNPVAVKQDDTVKLLSDACVSLFGCDIKEVTKQQMIK